MDIKEYIFSYALAQIKGMQELDVEAVTRILVDAVAWTGKNGVQYGPPLKRMILDVFDHMFSYRQVGRQIAIISIIQVVVLCCASLHDVWDKIRQRITVCGRKERALLLQLRRATNYEEWQRTAQRLDDIRGHNKWREEDSSPLYDCKMLKKRIENTEEMLQNGDVFNLMFRLRGGLARDQFGMQHEGLFSRAKAGTKLLVERYLETMCAGLDYVCDSPIADEEIPTDVKLAFFNETRYAYGRTALLLSGGGGLGFYHMGLIKTLWQLGLLPRIISGSSAGSIITGIVGTRNEKELGELTEMLVSSGKDELRLPPGLLIDFFKTSTDLQSERAKQLNDMVPQCLRWLSKPVLGMLYDGKLVHFDTNHIKECLRSDMGPYTFQEAFDRTGRIINITVVPLNQYDPPRLLNYLTAPHVCVWSAVAASCALPGVFEAASLVVKEPDGQFREEAEWTRKSLVENDGTKAANLHAYSDGSIENDLPMQQLAELFNVNHFIVSQVNPHSGLLAWMATANAWSSPLFTSVMGYMRFLIAQTRDWFKNLTDFLSFGSLTPMWSLRRGYVQALTQDYEGRDVDITINPWYGHISAFKAFNMTLQNPTLPVFKGMMRASESATYPALPRIHAHCCVEITLDQCVQRLRKRIADESHAAHMLAVCAQHEMEAENARTGRIDRTPSFYTSHSLVNLSGLSVSDPAPIHVWRPMQASGSHNSLSNSSAGVLMELPPNHTDPGVGVGAGVEAGVGYDHDTTRPGVTSIEDARSVGAGAGEVGRDLIMLPVTVKRTSWGHVHGSDGSLSSLGGTDAAEHGGSGVFAHPVGDNIRRGIRRRSTPGMYTTNPSTAPVPVPEGDEDKDSSDGDDFLLTLTVPMGDVPLKAHSPGADSYSFYVGGSADSVGSMDPSDFVDFIDDDSRDQGDNHHHQPQQQHQHQHHSVQYVPLRPASAPAGQQDLLLQQHGFGSGTDADPAAIMQSPQMQHFHQQQPPRPRQLLQRRGSTGAAGIAAGMTAAAGAGAGVGWGRPLVPDDRSVHKTSSMANFYYKRSNSSHSLQQWPHQQAQQQSTNQQQLQQTIAPHQVAAGNARPVADVGTNGAALRRGSR